MPWSEQAAKSDQASKIRWELVPYMVGRALDIGCAGYKVFPHFISWDGGSPYQRMPPDIIADTYDKLDILASQSFDCVFSSFTLQRTENWKKAITEWWRLVKPGGHLCLYLPDKSAMPKWEKTPDYKHALTQDDLMVFMFDLGRCDLVENQTRHEGDEFAFFQVYKKLKNRMHFYQSWKNPKPEKTCGIVRYGAFGDMIQISSILPWLKEQGYHITIYHGGNNVIAHDPHVDRFISQPKDIIPPQFLDEFWENEKKKYDKWINLSGSIEETLLIPPRRAAHEWPKEIKAKYLDRNYLEWTHELAGVPPPYHTRFYSTLEEKSWARLTSDRFGRKNILWSLAGSSVHKVWPWMDTILHRIIQTMPDVHVVLVGDEFCRLLETGWDDHPKVHCRSGKWSIRESMSFAEASDLVIGTETGLLNAAGMMDVPKIVTLSHSSPEMLTKHWKNTIVLEPHNVFCYPCRMMHNGDDGFKHCWEHKETGTAMCQADISADRMWEAITSVLGASERKVA